MNEQVNWSVPPWGVDPRQYIGQRLVSYSGQAVDLRRDGMHYVVTYGEHEALRTRDLAQVAYWFNTFDVRPVDERAPAPGQLGLFTGGGA